MYRFNIYDLSFILRGFLITIGVCLGTMVISSPVAILIGLIRALKSKNLILKGLQSILTLYIKAVRGTPLMLILMFLFFGLPFMGINLSPISSGIIGLSVYCVAYLAEIVRTGVESVAKTQWEGAAALGFTYLQTMRAIILPQAIKIMLPPSASFFIGLIKDSSLCSVIGFVELARAGRIIVEKTHQAFFVFGLVALLYFVICYPLSMMTQKMEKTLNA